MRCPRNQLLVLSALLVGGIGAQLIIEPPGAGFGQLERVMPFWLWGVVFVAAAVGAAVQAVVRRSPGAVSFGIMVGLLSAWGAGQMLSWWIRWLEGESQRSHGWIPAAMWILAAVILSIASRAIPHDDDPDGESDV